MRSPREVKEVQEVKEVKENRNEVAAFFDLDGTLSALPSLEKRFFRVLCYRKEIPSKNYFLWIAEAIRLLPRGIAAITQANKMYLRGVKVLDESGNGDGTVSAWHKDGRPCKGPRCLGVIRANQAEGQDSLAPPLRIQRLPVPSFFPEGLERVAWHAQRGHEIVLLSGTLEPLAHVAAWELEKELAKRGVKTTILVSATRLEKANDRWTGRVLGEAMFGEAKALAARKFAAERNQDLSHCFAYGDSAQDRWLLAAVGKPTAVNPSSQLAKIARKARWTIAQWNEEKGSTQRAQRRASQSSQKPQFSEMRTGT